ncbi:OLC1v1002002C1 [Oldenlandia corymbosa var. corymbosa]|uniref:OLC1v1002002C1 n=1 Tax=Oldenlandia corymbosa var. corymbosa TaxID=529605 RepID=A0AAV1D881_OLDCO|nr:OLC1v1002002C1 [Oldenlandia corymbosa var. corymbosa]
MSGKGCCYSSCRSSSAPKVEVKKEVDVKPQQVAPAVPAIVQHVKAEQVKEVKVEAEPVKEVKEEAEPVKVPVCAVGGNPAAN